LNAHRTQNSLAVFAHLQLAALNASTLHCDGRRGGLALQTATNGVAAAAATEAGINDDIVAARARADSRVASAVDGFQDPSVGGRKAIFLVEAAVWIGIGAGLAAVALPGRWVRRGLGVMHQLPLVPDALALLLGVAGIRVCQGARVVTASGLGVGTCASWPGGVAMRAGTRFICSSHVVSRQSEKAQSPTNCTHMCGQLVHATRGQPLRKMPLTCSRSNGPRCKEPGTNPYEPRQCISTPAATAAEVGTARAV
jgi:hypothetical protein